MKIAVTGATGYVGQMLVPLLEQSKHRVLVCGRKIEKLKQLFPANEATIYPGLRESLVGVDLVVHLAVLNNNQASSDLDFNTVNIDLALSTAQIAKRAGVKKFVFVSSVQAISHDINSGYAISKRVAAKQLEAITGLEIRVVYLPLVFGSNWSQSLNFLNHFWSPLAQIFFRPLAAMKPTVNIVKLAKYLDDTDEVKKHSSEAEIILAEDMEQNNYYRVFRKIVDIGFSFVIVLAFGWLIFVFWFLIKLDSPGPGLFVQSRVGRNRREFNCYKLRTMKVGTAQLGTHELSAAALTHIGTFLRKYKIDELPQVVNILKGEMTLVGPRPCLPNQIKLIEEREKLNVLVCVPGITGFSQVQNIDMSNPYLLAKSDARYVSLKSILLDIKIILATFKGRGFSDKIL
jgi:lipopolysaccharide/colanic/teichoic acid biosynthesis glycosyltransferase